MTAQCQPPSESQPLDVGTALCQRDYIGDLRGSESELRTKGPKGHFLNCRALVTFNGSAGGGHQRTPLLYIIIMPKKILD